MLEIIKNMMCENTGKNLLDSGDAYGRHYEENQKKWYHDRSPKS